MIQDEVLRLSDNRFLLRIAGARDGFFNRKPFDKVDLAVVPQNTWHRFHAPNGVSIVTATPRPTEHLTVDVADPRTLSDADRSANSEAKVG